VTIGVAGGLHYGIRTPNIGAREDYWVISQLHIIGGTQAMDWAASAGGSSAMTCNARADDQSA